MKKEEKGGV